MPTPRPEKQASYGSLRWTHCQQSPTRLPIIGRPGTLGQRPGTGLLCPPSTARGAEHRRQLPHHWLPQPGPRRGPRTPGGRSVTGFLWLSHWGGAFRGLSPILLPRREGILRSFRGLCMEGAEIRTPKPSSEGSVYVATGRELLFLEAGLTLVLRRRGPGEPQGARGAPPPHAPEPHSPSQDTVPHREQ